MGGVINIITRKGRVRPASSVSGEDRQLRSKAGRATVSGSHGARLLRFLDTGFDTAGFSRYGYNIGRIEGCALLATRGRQRKAVGHGGACRVASAPDVEFEFGGYATSNTAQYDAAHPPSILPDAPLRTQQRFFEGYSRA